MLSTSGRTASHLNYLGVQPCIAGPEPFGTPLDWSVHSGSIKLGVYI
jgi:hypothetical protein